ncbi:MAG: YkgJ family cysteine cluster protein [Verrucomicrobiota bacterium]
MANNPTAPIACLRCGACCRQPGDVRLQDDETETIAHFLRLSILGFTAAYTRLRANRTGLVLAEAADGACIFLQDNLCRIQSVKPRQCRDYPETWHIPGEEQFCRARHDPRLR